VRERIADYMSESVERRAAAQYIALLVSNAKIEGMEIAGAESHRVN
jgi:peptidyl-prolyl cis-trans isomerase C